MTTRQGSRRVAAFTAVLMTAGASLLSLGAADAAPSAGRSVKLPTKAPELVAEFDQQDRTVLPGHRFSVSGRIGTVAPGRTFTLDDGVPASFTLEIVSPDGRALATQDGYGWSPGHLRHPRPRVRDQGHEERQDRCPGSPGDGRVVQVAACG